MIQLYAYKDGARYELDTYAEEPIKLTISAEDITDIPKVESSFSRQFRIPATQTNSQFFNYWYELSVVDFDVTQKVKAEIHVDGLIFKSGELRLNAAYKNRETNNIDFEVVFYGETRDFASEVGDIFLNGLNTTEIDHVLDHPLMHQTQLNWGDPNLALDGYLRYGLAIRGYEYDEDGNVIRYDATNPDPYQTPVHGQITLDNTEQFAFTNQNSAIDVRQYTPMIQVKYLMDKIFDRTSYTYSDDSVFNEDWFRNVYTDGIADSTGYTPVNQPLCSVFTDFPGPLFPTDTDYRINFTTAELNVGNSFNLQQDKFVVATTSANIFDFRVRVRVSDVPGLFQAGGYILKIFKNGVNVAQTTETIPANNFGNILIETTYSSALNAGDEIWAVVEAINGARTPRLEFGNFEQTAGTASVLGSTLLKSDVKIVDFLKSVLNRFRLVMVPSKTAPLEFVIKPWKDYITTGDKFDWTHKLDNSKDIVVKPIFFEQSATILFEDTQDEDQYNQLYLTENNHVYGRYIYDSNNELLKDEREIENIFAPTPVAKVRGSIGPNDMIIPILAKESEEQDKDGFNKYLPLLTKPRLLFWNGQQPTTEGFFDEKVSGNEHFFYGSFSPYQFNSYDSETWADYPDATTFDLNWKTDVRYWDFATPAGISTYDVYWSDYINSIYNKDARIVTAYFMLDSLDLKDLTFDDVIYVNENYYRVQKVYDAPLNMLAPTKVDLVKLLDYTPTFEEVDPGSDGQTGGGDTPVDTGGGGGTPVEEPVEGPAAYQPVAINATLDWLEPHPGVYVADDSSADNQLRNNIMTLLRLRDPSTNNIISASALGLESTGWIRITNVDLQQTAPVQADVDVWFQLCYNNLLYVWADGATTNGNSQPALVDPSRVWTFNAPAPGQWITNAPTAGFNFSDFDNIANTAIYYYEPQLDPATNQFRWTFSDVYQ